ncbi:hypothetical protein BKA66DRAFT_549356 [Pyrenochaeta sp. MPI-SDFR-AT-0127]|nr:hypothetical protein BKA66DRAFT_549356 [Pyrenochaeta sp. MPI-SDFR-AT-0127]
MVRFLGLRGTRLTTAISATCGLCFLCYGYAQGVMGGLLTVTPFIEHFPEVDIVTSLSFHNAWVTGLTVGAWNLGCVVSSILAIFIGDLLGRRRTLLLGLTLWVIGETIQTSSYSLTQFIVGRAIAGFGNGFNTSTAPAYQAECVKSHRKGTILMISAGAFVSFGLALSYWLVFGLAYISGSSAAWRVPIACQVVFALPAVALLFILPESPRWLILTGREQEALTVLAALNDSDVDDFEIRDEFLQIKDAILTMAQGTTASMFSNKERRSFHRVVLANFVQVFQQGTGINLVLQYLSWILLTRMSYSAWLSRLLASCSATTYFLASFVTVVGIDRFWGRRSLMLFGAAGMSGCMVLLTILQYLWYEQASNAARIASAVFLFGFSMFFAIGWQGMAWLYQVEIVPLRVRGPANALSSCANWMLNFAIVFITPIAFQRISYHTWIILAASNFAIIPLVYFFYPETAFRSLEEVDVIFQLANDAPGNPWLNAVKISKSEPLWFGERGEKAFDYANSSWHKRLMDSMLSSGSGSRSGSVSYGKRKGRARYGLGEKGELGSYSSGMDPYTKSTRHHRGRSESPIDPRLTPSPPPLSHSNTVTTTIESEFSYKPKRLRKKNSQTMLESTYRDRRGTPVFDHTAHTVALPPSSRMTRSNSVESYHSLHQDWWTRDLAPIPPSLHSRTPSLNRGRSRPGTSETQRSFIRPSTFSNLSLFSDEEYAHFSGYDNASYHSYSAPQHEDLQNTVTYPGRIGGERVVRTRGGRERYIIDGVSDDMDRDRRIGSPDSIDSGSVRRLARGAGRAN